MNTPEVTLHLRKNGKRYTRMASGLRYAKANGQSCILYFKNGETFVYSYRLALLLREVHCLVYLVKVHRSYIINIHKAENYSYLKAKLRDCTEEIPLNDYGYAVVKEFVDKKNSQPDTPGFPSTAA